MDLSSLKNTPGARKSRKRVGRGRASGMGKTSTHGHKGQGARKGHKQKLGFEGGQMPLFRRMPKRGFKNPNRIEYFGVNLAKLERFEDGTVVTAEVLAAAGISKTGKDGIKILGYGDLTKKLTVEANAFSASAKEKIEKLGGTCKVV